jgi:Reverse transcriptase (RNA-dependent DNA polymerase)
VLVVLTTVALIDKGYIPREMPHAFTSSPLAVLYNAHAGLLPLSTDPTECIRHNLARPNGFRRPLKLPNPRSYIRLAKALERHWVEVDSLCKGQTLAISRPVVTRTAERAVRPRVRLGEGQKLRARLWRGQKYVLFCDVGQFYPSLYTHAIPWALHTKPYAKANRNRTNGDEIDREVRRGQSGQTVGIPIGPDTSFVIAEIVLSGVDDLLTQRLSGYRGFRYLDDYEAAFPTRSEAEEAQGHLESALGEFELVINPFKTRVVELPQPFRSTWPRELARFRYARRVRSRW